MYFILFFNNNNKRIKGGNKGLLCETERTLLINRRFPRIGLILKKWVTRKIATYSKLLIKNIVKYTFSAQYRSHRTRNRY